MQGMDKWLDKAGQVAEGAAKAGAGLVNKGRNKVDQMALRSRLGKLQRQLGALVYMLRKGGDENEAMIDWYVAEIDRIKAKLATLEAPFEDDYTVYASEDIAEDETGAVFPGGE